MKTITAPVADHWQQRADAWTEEKASHLRSVARLNLELRRLHRARRLSLDRALTLHLTAQIRSVRRELDAVHEQVREVRHIAFKLSQMVEEIRAI